jgi:hypothetical protein
MLHAHFQAPAGKSKPFGKSPVHLPVIYIAVHAPEWLEGLKLVGKFSSAKIAGMPYFVNVFKVFEHLRIEVAVGVGEEADKGHGNLLYQFRSKEMKEWEDLFHKLLLSHWTFVLH